MEITESKVEDTSTLQVGWIIKILCCIQGHGLNIGECYRIHSIEDSRSIRAGSLDDNQELNQSYLNIDEFKLIQETTGKIFKTAQAFDITHLDRVVLPDGHKRAILETLTQEHEENNRILFEDWGFGEGFEKGKGIIFLFYGIPGTGKTMCAEMMAKYLNKDHIMMGNADVQSSVPGQAERNIKKIFADAKSGKYIVIIDECDTLLYNRNSVGAIMAGEINCLLSEIERFDGVVVLTSNRNHKLDPALERRIALKLEFPSPSQEIRKRIWKKLIPDTCPLHKNVSYTKLAAHNLCGGNIKNIIFSAARKTLHDKRRKVRMSDFEVSIKREKDGKGAFKSIDRVVTEAEMSSGSEIVKSRSGDQTIKFKENYNV